MKAMYKYILFVVFISTLLSLPLNGRAQDINDYTAYPPFVTTALSPNILLDLDVSGSMQCSSYLRYNWGGTTNGSAWCGQYNSSNAPQYAYDSQRNYYGYFKTDKYYSYGTNKFVENASCIDTDRIGSQGCISGNLLNWATMSRIDLLRKALIGGKSVSLQQNAHTLRGEGGRWIYTDDNLGCSFNVSGGIYPNLDHTLTISNSGGFAGTCTPDPTYSDDFNDGVIDSKWTEDDIPNSVQGSASEGGGNLSVQSDGSTIWGSSDDFYYVYQTLSGDFDVRLRIITPPTESGQTFAKAGLMVRASTAANSRRVMVNATYGSGLQFARRTTDGGGTGTFASYVGIGYPVWVRLVRQGDTFTAFYSSDGTNWTQHGNTTVSMPNNVLVGMATASYQDGVLGTGVYDEFVYCGGGSGCKVGTLSNANIKIDVPENERKGIIQRISDTDDDGNFDENAPRFGLMVYSSGSGSYNRRGCIRVGIEGANLSALITGIQNESPRGGTPTGPSLEEAWDYFAQENNYSNCNNSAYIGGPQSNQDPWCDNNDSPPPLRVPVPCRKSFVLLISDGEWNVGSDPVRPARGSHINDIRTDPGMDGTQILKHYTVFIFGSAGTGRNAMQQTAMFGAFDDLDVNTWPYNRTGYPANSRNVTLPASPCDPNSQWDDECKEWDENSDGIPDTYYEASSGAQLEKALLKAIADIMRRASAGTSVSVLSTTGEGEGAVYQAYFYPEFTTATERITWMGHLRALFVDKYGNLREDTDGDDALSLTADYILRMRYDVAQGTLVDRYSDTDGDGEANNLIGTVMMDEVLPIWDGAIRLFQTDPDNRRIYTTLTGYDFSGLPIDAVKGNFREANKAALQPYLRASDTDSNTEAENIIKWIRGYDFTDDKSGYDFNLYVTDDGHPNGYRTRYITLNNETHVWKLGDIVYSTPTVVSRPMENYDLLYNDPSYTDFRLKYINRRHVVYVGANDGMLHAFNGGFYDGDNHRYCKGGDSNGDKSISDTECLSGSYELGDVLWEFIPGGLLPHLKWLTDPDYTHVYFVDLKPKATDVKIFDDDSTHINSWGTILIGGLRYGGKDISWTSGSTSYSASPEYFAFDITDPEQSPKLLWTFSDPDLGLSMSYPAVARVCDSNGSTWNEPNCKWFVVFGSGATDYDINSDLTTYQSGNIYILDISSGTNGVVTSWTLGTNYWKIPTNTQDNNSLNTFLADVISVDVDLDYDVDVFYLGENYKQGANWNSLMLRLTTDRGENNNPSTWTTSLSTLGDINSIAGSNDISKRITSAPSAAMDERANLWVYFGTGQFLGSLDKNQTDTGAFYAIKDGCWNGSCTTSYTDLLDVSGAEVNTSGNVSGVSGSCGGTKSNWSELITAMNGCDGWVMYFENIGENVDFLGETLSHNGERALTKPLVLGGLVIWATYIPGGDICSTGGESNVYAVYYKTGTAYKDYVFSEQDTGTVVARVKKFGKGIPSSVSAQITSGGSAKGFAQQSTGSILEIESITPFTLRSGTTGWKSEQIP